MGCRGLASFWGTPYHVGRVGHYACRLVAAGARTYVVVPPQVGGRAIAYVPHVDCPLFSES